MFTKILAVIFLFGGIFITIAASQKIYKILFLIEKDYSTVDGEILSVEIINDITSLGVASEGKLYYKPQVEYSYIVNGETFNNSRIRLMEKSYSREKDAQEVTEIFKEGASVNVLYNLTDPQDSFLDNSVTISDWMGIAIGVIFAPLGIYLLK